MMNHSYRIAILDNTIHHMLKSYESLKDEFPHAELFSQEGELYEFMEKHPLDLILLNLDLFPNDAIHVVQEIRALSRRPPFLVVYSLKQDDFVQETVLNAGSDAIINFHRKPHILKPFVRNILRRRLQTVTAIGIPGLTLDEEKHLVLRKGLPVPVPRKEFLILRLLLTETGKFFSRSEIAYAVWQDDKVAQKRAIDVHIYNLRQMLGRNVIQSLKGRGYRLNEHFNASLY